MPLHCDLENVEEVKSIIPRMEHIDVCVYLAANTNVREMVKDPTIDVATNISTLLNFFKYFKGQKLIYFSSGAVYMGLEGKVSPHSKIDPTIPYAISKYACEEYVKFYKKMKKTFEEYVILRFFGAYGPYESPRKISTKLIELIKDPTRNEFVIYGDGRNFIDFMYINDAIKGLLSVIKSMKANVTVDFCSGEPRTINELVMEAGHIFNKKINIKHTGSSPEYIKFYASPKEMFRLFHFKPETSLNDGFKDFSSWLDNADESKGK